VLAEPEFLETKCLDKSLLSFQQWFSNQCCFINYPYLITHSHEVRLDVIGSITLQTKPALSELMQRAQLLQEGEEEERK